MVKTQRRQDKEAAIRALIADAVATVIIREGVANVSVEMIAKEAGLSKGGVFYYYPTKTQLMLSLLDRYSKHFRKRCDELLESLPDTRDRFIKACFTALFEDIDYVKGDRLYLAKLLDVPGFRDALAKLKIDLLARLREGVKNPENITLAYLLFDGLWIDMLLKPNPVFERDFELVKQRAWELLGRLEFEDGPAEK